MFPSPFETLPAYLSSDADEQWRLLRVERNQSHRLLGHHSECDCQKRIRTLMFCALAEVWWNIFRGGTDSNAAMIQHWNRVVTESYSWQIHLVLTLRACGTLTKHFLQAFKAYKGPPLLALTFRNLASYI
jgi:hypothetical protein